MLVKIIPFVIQCKPGAWVSAHNPMPVLHLIAVFLIVRDRESFICFKAKSGSTSTALFYLNEIK